MAIFPASPICVSAWLSSKIGSCWCPSCSDRLLFFAAPRIVDAQARTARVAWLRGLCAGIARWGRPPRGRGGWLLAMGLGGVARTVLGHCCVAVGLGRGTPAEGPGHTFKDYTKPRQILHSPKKTIRRHKKVDKTKNIRHRPKILSRHTKVDKTQKIRQGPKIFSTDSFKYQFDL